MAILIHNTKSNRKEKLQPLEEGHVKMYVCGVTVYDYCHIGHARSALVFDMICKYLRHRGYKVTFIRNLTDIDDKIIKRAQEQGSSCEELSQHFIKMFREDMAALGVEAPTLEPLATEHITEMIALVQQLIDQGLAYEVGGDVYYRVQGFAAYGTLSGRSLEDIQAGARVAINDNKEHPFDFVLWKSSKPNEPSWESPWGAGRPGWHIECSAMSKKYLGQSFDIHGGGQDLIFPHHENEIAQSEGVSGQTLVKIWIHHGFVTIKDEKMSKSLGNFLTIRQVLARYPAEALRLFVFATHYRNPLDYSEAAIADAEAGLTRLYAALAKIADLPTEGDDAKVPPRINAEDREKLEKLEENFNQAMDFDFNSALALGQIFDAVKIINKLCQSLTPHPAPQDLRLLRATAAKMQKLAGIFGLLGENPTVYQQNRKEKMMVKLGIRPAVIEKLIAERQAARQSRNWAEADRIRDQLASQHIAIKDGLNGTTWEIAG